MKKLMMVMATVFAAAMPLIAETEMVGGYLWVSGGATEIMI